MLIRQFAHVAMTQSFNNCFYNKGMKFKARFDQVWRPGNYDDFRLPPHHESRMLRQLSIRSSRRIMQTFDVKDLS